MNTSDIRLNDGAIGRVWPTGRRFKWAHPDGSQGDADTFAEAEAELNAGATPAASASRQHDRTPGPWKLDPVWNLILGPDGQEVCAIHASSEPPRVGLNEAAGNAALIESAPVMAAEIAALREALTAVYEDWRTLSGIDHGAGDEYEDVRNIDAKARAAIANIEHNHA